MSDDYLDFLKAKMVSAPVAGLDLVDRTGPVNPALKPHCKVIVPWALRGGRRAIFARFGLHKTSMQIEIERQILAAEGGAGLIVCPLGVKQEFFRDAELYFIGEFGVRMKFIRRPEEIEDGCIHLTNYETVRDGKLDPTLFKVACLDEASCLRGFGSSKTFREFMRLFAGVAYKFVATATPSPNDFIELLAYAAFLEIMDVGEAKTRFFKRNSEKADKLTIHPHKEEEFWRWISSWAVFISKPSDLGFSDDGYILPELDVRWHEIPADHAHAGFEASGQGRLLKEAAIGVQNAAAEKRSSLDARIAKVLELRAEAPDEHRILWHDLEAERHALEKAIPTAKAIWGSQDLDERERRVIDFSEGCFAELAAKPSIAGSGCNFQRHCAWEIFVGVGFKFNDLIQAIHRVQRFGQTRGVRIDLIYTEAERPVRREIERKWAQHMEMEKRMVEIVKKYGLTQAAMGDILVRSLGVERVEASGHNYRCINNDCVEEVRRMPDASIDLIVTSIPFSTQYEYSPSYNDFGHTDNDEHFFRQMDFLIPELLRVVKPGRVAAIHVKDRITPGGINGLGFQTVSPFSDLTVERFRRHGWAFMARKTVTTDVVRENNQTYRLGWTEQCKDGTKMGYGLPEYVLLFRRPPTDRSNGYADEPVRKSKKRWVDPVDGPIEDGEMPSEGGGNSARYWEAADGYSRARWQIDAHGHTRSSGDRPLAPEDYIGLDAGDVWKLWKRENLARVYDFEHHVRVAEALDIAGSLPVTFMLLPPHSPHPDVWTDITRMRTMNTLQAGAGREQHLCPLQFDIVDRLIVQMSQPGETVLDPFGGLMTVPYCAIKLGRRGVGIELNPGYWLDGVKYCEAAEEEVETPTLFDLIGMDVEAAE
ncbi:conserved hypothetical protein [uncultured Pleomorphomonas sp.]|uniref:site-specific DNA-methyltransferase (adenine-specific) n=1 Tax=uncultured Pleomorphomonas sp. TaxID=442121 RepID=A0A212L7H4_9HYPH|nr:DNA methyltransferase [uncultured Pleomorphomonas sp.]SCM73427.1 conserved hypothetical protein [uncultured Pleomorphomonas sp.]